MVQDADVPTVKLMHTALGVTVRAAGLATMVRDVVVHGVSNEEQN